MGKNISQTYMYHKKFKKNSTFLIFSCIYKYCWVCFYVFFNADCYDNEVKKDKLTKNISFPLQINQEYYCELSGSVDSDINNKVSLCGSNISIDLDLSHKTASLYYLQ